MNNSIPTKYFRYSVISLFIVAVLGTLMRYKIAFSFPYFDQKNLLHAHSYFAFSGWISHFLYCGLASIILKYITTKRYNILITANLVCATGMLVSFAIKGYNITSIIFSTCGILVGLLFAIQLIGDWRKVKEEHPSKNWSIAAVALNIIASAGPLFLAYMIFSHTTTHKTYLGSVYYYLHFQYSGWFFFASMAMIVDRIQNKTSILNKYFLVFAITVIPTFFLSILWANLPMWLYAITVAATFVQLIAWYHLLYKYFKDVNHYLKENFPSWVRLLCYSAILAISIKFLLQAISVIPSLSQLVFGIRPIVIAYLHLVLLGVYTLFFLAYLVMNNYLKQKPIIKKATMAFLTGVILNELLLGIQGFAAFFYIPIPYVNLLLLLAALVLLISAGTLMASQFSTGED
ncbi:MAG TPA: hypothetical protein PLC76_08790 [Saprospiraceae bacterium]|nr:hypothetical protein [Candidatus Parvibacillus calidus]MBX2937523.1 hypothetical protein [Saprospiraceae bacterium]MBX7177986.1 hypothetical protein [Saprospiraceae bacterium]MCB0592356.1 hypothetical protein [Saprospiraceae bacterium]MCC7149522.1 hypothetical protein [Saprospiraceae bacterium]